MSGDQEWELIMFVGTHCIVKNSMQLYYFKPNDRCSIFLESRMATVKFKWVSTGLLE